MNRGGDAGLGPRVGVPWLHLRIGVMNELHYRANFFVQLFQSIVFTGTGLIALSLIFRQTNELGGWTEPQLLVVLGMYTAIGGFIGFVIEPNMARIMADVETGLFDHVLTKPVDSQLLASFREFRLWRLFDVLAGAGVATWGVVELGGGLGVLEVAGFVAMVTTGMVLVYCAWLVVTTGAFWFVRMRAVQDLFTGMYRAGQYPVTVYPVGLRLVLTYLVPIGFAVTVPSESLTGRLTWTSALTSLAFLAAALAVTRWVWKLGTRHYSGASA